MHDAEAVIRSPRESKMERFIINLSVLMVGAAMLTFIVSSYLVVLKYPTPIGITEKLRKD